MTSLELAITAFIPALWTGSMAAAVAIVRALWLHPADDNADVLTAFGATVITVIAAFLWTLWSAFVFLKWGAF